MPYIQLCKSDSDLLIGFWRPFDTLDDMMAYAASCRFHDPARGAAKEKNRAKLKSNDRRRIQYRQAFATWIDDYLPAHGEDPIGESSGMTRDDVIQDAKRVFGEEFAEDFEKKKAEGVWTMGVERLWASIRKDLPIEGIEIGYVMKGLRKEIVGDAEDTEELSEVQQAYKEGDFEKVAAWAGEHWREVGERQKAFDREKSTRNLLEKLARESLKKDQAQNAE